MSALNPRTGEADYGFAPDSSDSLMAKAAELRSLHADWQGRGVGYRAEVLNRFADALLAHREAILTALAIDTGRTAIAAMEIDGTIGSIRGWAARAPEIFRTLDSGTRPSVTPGITIDERYHAFALFGAISPWNFPMLLAHVDAVPAWWPDVRRWLSQAR